MDSVRFYTRPTVVTTRWTTSGTGPVQLATLTFSYDAAFSPAGELFVSAATGGFGAGNDIFKVALPGGALTQIAHVGGPSGPLTFGANGSA